MSIIDTFDFNGEEVIKPHDMIQGIDNFPKKVIVTFSHKFIDQAMESYDLEEIGCLKAGVKIPLYKIVYKNEPIVFYNTVVGAAGTAALLEEVMALGAEEILFFGSCGALDKSIAAGHLIVPTSAYRDEGVSYHYAEASDFFDVETADKLSSIFDELQIPYIKTKTWTTDSIYRETSRNMEKRKAMGCSVVDMECASVMSVGKHRGKNIYQFLYAADCLDSEKWDERILLGKMPKNMIDRVLLVALETIIRV